MSRGPLPLPAVPSISICPFPPRIEMEVTYDDHQIEQLLPPSDRVCHPGSVGGDRRDPLHWGPYVRQLQAAQAGA